MATKVRRRNERKGLSTVVGAVFMIIVMASALNVTLWTMRQQDKVTETVIEKTNTNLNKLNEDIGISDIRISGGKLNVTVTNVGGAASNLKTLYIVNETASPKQQYKYDLDAAVDGRTSAINIGQSSPSVVLKDDTDYSVKVVAQSGATASSKVTSLTSTALPMSLYLIPPTVVPGSNVTVLFAVTNNLTVGHIASNPELKLSYTMTCGTGPGCKLDKVSEPSSNATMISKGNTMFYKWVFKTTAPDKSYVTFNASFVNAKQGNYVTETAYLKTIDASQTATSSLQVIFTSLVQKPDIFLILPSTFGDSASQGLWGVIIANPVNATMKVSRVVLNMYSSKSTAGGVQLIDGCPSGPCSSDLTTIYPSTGWTRPHENMVEWKNIASPETIKDYEAKSFLFRVKPGAVTDAEPAFTVTASVFTDFGQFTKTGYAVGMDDGNQPLVNVYMTDTDIPSQADDDTHMLGHKINFTSGQYVKFNVTIADLDADSGTYVKSGSNLTINVPQGFSKANVTDYTGFNEPVKRQFYDGSTQFTASLSSQVGDIGTSEAKIIEFEAFAPSVTSKKIYIMYILADGETQNNFSIGPVGEIVLQIKPTGT